MSPPQQESQKVVQLEFANRKQYQYKALLESNPTPTDMTSAQKFFREQCEATIRWRKDHDYLRVVLKGADVEEEKAKFERSVELPLNDRKRYEERVIALAEAMHYLWLDLEAPKQ